jgi:dTDP-4-dehydrorhamnose 3,5-epimerase
MLCARRCHQPLAEEGKKVLMDTTPQRVVQQAPVRRGSIDGVVVQPLVRHPDDRGYFEELIRTDDAWFGEGFGQLSHSKMYPGVVKAWHIHKTQIDWWYVAAGRLLVALHDLREHSSTYHVTQELYLGDDLPPTVLKIPAGVAHGCRAIGIEPSHLFYVTSRTYDPDEEGRIAHDDPAIGFDWLREPPIK